MHYYCAYDIAMTRRRQQHHDAPNAGKRRLLRRVLRLQRGKLLQAEARGDNAGVERIEQRMVCAEALIAELEAR